MSDKQKKANVRLDDPTGTVEQKPRWESPSESRPKGYLPAKDDPDPDAAGANLKDPDKRILEDASTKKDS